MPTENKHTSITPFYLISFEFAECRGHKKYQGKAAWTSNWSLCTTVKQSYCSGSGPCIWGRGYFAKSVVVTLPKLVLWPLHAWVNSFKMYTEQSLSSSFKHCFIKLCIISLSIFIHYYFIISSKTCILPKDLSSESIRAQHLNFTDTKYRYIDLYATFLRRQMSDCDYIISFQSISKITYIFCQQQHVIHTYYRKYIYWQFNGSLRSMLSRVNITLGMALTKILYTCQKLVIKYSALITSSLPEKFSGSESSISFRMGKE